MKPTGEMKEALRQHHVECGVERAEDFSNRFLTGAVEAVLGAITLEELEEAWANA